MPAGYGGWRPPGPASAPGWQGGCAATAGRGAAVPLPHAGRSLQRSARVRAALRDRRTGYPSAHPDGSRPDRTVLGLSTGHISARHRSRQLVESLPRIHPPSGGGPDPPKCQTTLQRRIGSTDIGGAMSNPLIHPAAAGAQHAHGDKFQEDDFFGEQPSTRSELPDPEPLLINLTRCVIEVLAGARELDQLARWVSDDVYKHLLKRVVLSARARAVKGQRAQRPTITIGRITISEPRDGVIEAVVIVHSKVRVRAVALRLEGLDHRWRASAINVL